MKNEETSRIERLEQLIQSKPFHELSMEEKNFVLEEFESEEHYTSMQKLSPILSKMPTQPVEIEPRPSTLEFLKNNLSTATATSSIWSTLFGWKMPAYASALVTVLGCSITWWLTAIPAKEIMTSPVITQTDTVYLATKPDTIVKEKIVYRSVRITSEPNPSTEVKHILNTQKEMVPVGVSMKDNEELEKLLVSGGR